MKYNDFNRLLLSVISKHIEIINLILIKDLEQGNKHDLSFMISLYYSNKYQEH